MLHVCTISWMFYLVFDKWLMCSSLEKMISPTSSFLTYVQSFACGCDLLGFPLSILSLVFSLLSSWFGQSCWWGCIWVSSEFTRKHRRDRKFYSKLIIIFPGSNNPLSYFIWWLLNLRWGSCIIDVFIASGFHNSGFRLFVVFDNCLCCREFPWWGLDL